MLVNCSSWRSSPGLKTSPRLKQSPGLKPSPGAKAKPEAKEINMVSVGCRSVCLHSSSGRHYRETKVGRLLPPSHQGRPSTSFFFFFPFGCVSLITIGFCWMTITLELSKSFQKLIRDVTLEICLLQFIRKAHMGRKCSELEVKDVKFPHHTIMSLRDVLLHLCIRTCLDGLDTETDLWGWNIFFEVGTWD